MYFNIKCKVLYILCFKFWPPPSKSVWWWGPIKSTVLFPPHHLFLIKDHQIKPAKGFSLEFATCHVGWHEASFDITLAHYKWVFCSSCSTYKVRARLDRNSRPDPACIVHNAAVVPITIRGHVPLASIVVVETVRSRSPIPYVCFVNCVISY